MTCYMLANGQGKARAGRSGAARQRYNWRLMFLSSGETSLSSHMQEAGKRAKAGQEIRMVDIPADCGCGMGIFEDIHDFDSPRVFADHLKMESGRYFGIAGDLFLEKLVMEDELSLHTKIQNIQIDFMKRYPNISHGQTQRVAQRFSLAAAAGEIATEFGITGWSDGVAITAAAKCFEAWLSLRDGYAVSHEEEETLKQVRHFFQENAARFDVFDCVQGYINRHIPVRCAGFRSGSGDFYVFPKTFADEVCKGLGSAKEVAKMVEKPGWLILDPKSKSPYTSIWVPTQGKTIRLYHFSGRVIGEDKEN